MVCDTGLAKVAKDVKENRARIGNLEVRVEAVVTKQDQLEEKNKTQDIRMDMQEKLMKDLQDQLSKVQGGTGEKVLEEIAERGSRERNVVCHKCPESHVNVPEDAKRDDMDGVQGLFEHLGLAMRADQVLIGLRRLGKVRDDGQARPLLLIFKNKQDRDKLLERAPKLSKDKESYWRDINIVADLTQKQRQLVLESTGEEGERVLRQVELRQGEMISTEGKVVLRTGEGQDMAIGLGQMQRREKRPHSSGSTPPARGWRRFGVRE